MADANIRILSPSFPRNWEKEGKDGKRGKRGIMISEMEAVDFGMVKFVDDRHFCTECVYYKQRTYMGKCNKEKIQYPKFLNRCNMFATKVLQTTEAFWEVDQEKPFWEI